MPRDFHRARPTDRERYEHMRDAARDVVAFVAFVAGRQRADLDGDVLLRRALANAVQEIGEAASKISGEARALAPSIPWGKIIETRNIIVHVYRGIDRDVLWTIANDRVVELIESVESALSTMPPVTSTEN